MVTPIWYSEKGGEDHSACSTFVQKAGEILLADGLDGTGGDAGSAINASAFVHHGFVAFHMQGANRAYIDASSATDAGILINLNCHFKAP
jgi:hypothetical protein